MNRKDLMAVIKVVEKFGGLPKLEETYNEWIAQRDKLAQIEAQFNVFANSNFSGLSGAEYALNFLRDLKETLQ